MIALSHKVIPEFQGDYRFLSNFWPSQIIKEGILYPTVEHAYQASKTLDPILHRKIAMEPTPGRAKRWGRRLELQPDWNAIKLDIMLDLIVRKFINADLRERLLLTQDWELQEGNSWGDRFWGISPVGSSNGANHLGKILMKVRQEYRTNDSTQP